MAKPCGTISAIGPENNRRSRTAKDTKFSAKRSGSSNDSSSVIIEICKW